eukprot:365603-Chlamydomonas_euryale.AAC.9
MAAFLCFTSRPRQQTFDQHLTHAPPPETSVHLLTRLPAAPRSHAPLRLVSAAAQQNAWLASMPPNAASAPRACPSRAPASCRKRATQARRPPRSRCEQRSMETCAAALAIAQSSTHARCAGTGCARERALTQHACADCTCGCLMLLRAERPSLAQAFAAGVDIEDLGLNCVPNARPAPPSGSTALPPPPAHACADDGKLEYPLGNGRMLHVPRSLQQVCQQGRRMLWLTRARG